MKTLFKMTYKEQLKSPFWQRKRLEIMNRDNFTCRNCGSNTKQLNVHHIYYEIGAKVWEYDNECYITLCKNCHTYIHDMNKVISLLAKNVIDNKIDLVELSNLINKT